MLWVVMTAGALLVLGWVLLAVAATHPPRAPLFLTPFDVQVSFDPVAFPSRDGTPLSGWWISHPRPRGVAVLCHGYVANRCEVLGVALELRRLGFSCLLFDFRAHGESGGRVTTIGAREVQDALGAVDFAARFGLPILLFGSSMGGAVAIMTAARDQRVGAVIADSAYARLAHAANTWWEAGFGRVLGKLCRPVKYVAMLFTRTPLSHAEPIREIGKIAPRPVLLIHGDRDHLVPVEHAYALYQAAGEPRTLWIANGSGHVQARVDQPENYYGQIAEFVEKWLEVQPVHESLNARPGEITSS
ncbi:MAG: alpha/beta hydrolase [Armatimonadota bacterium]|nr:MAG: alpha/beta hydrolase [Armatimonadota bacterium]